MKQRRVIESCPQATKTPGKVIQGIEYDWHACVCQCISDHPRFLSATDHRGQLVRFAKGEGLQNIAGTIGSEDKNTVPRRGTKSLLASGADQRQVLVVSAQFLKCRFQEHPMRGARATQAVATAAIDIDIHHRLALEAVKTAIKAHQRALTGDRSVAGGGH